ncbi:hypothetical protein P7K49_005959 [Saguinus oedipus]|uniref:IRS-type PTB domain-containing protein n=1 Tax=Saguinus oedipus TaxID=9490 RepID=A0ABQ9W126_SAGOE|nr:hypothetical protein P7K49_005959 [Saguinus oedipus]
MATLPADCLLMLAYKDKSERAKGLRERSSLTLEDICGLEPGLPYEGLAHTLAIVCLSQAVMLGFDSHEAMCAWDARIRYALGEARGPSPTWATEVEAALGTGAGGWDLHGRLRGRAVAQLNLHRTRPDKEMPKAAAEEAEEEAWDGNGVPFALEVEMEPVGPLVGRLLSAWVLTWERGKAGAAPRPVQPPGQGSCDECHLLILPSLAPGSPVGGCPCLTLVPRLPSFGPCTCPPRSGPCLLCDALSPRPPTVHRFHVTVAPGTKLESGPATLHLCNDILVLARDIPPAVSGQWKLSDLRRYGAVPNGFIFEGGTRTPRQGNSVFPHLVSEVLCPRNLSVER